MKSILPISVAAAALAAAAVYLACRPQQDVFSPRPSTSVSRPAVPTCEPLCIEARSISDGTGHTLPESCLGHPQDEFSMRLDRWTREGDKHACQELLKLWRSSASTQERDRQIEEALKDLTSEDCVTSAGTLLTMEALEEQQIDGLCAILASAGTSTALEFLLAAAELPQTRLIALGHLRTLSAQDLVTPLAAHIRATSDHDLQRALAQALEGVGTPEALVALEQSGGLALTSRP